MNGGQSGIGAPVNRFLIGAKIGDFTRNAFRNSVRRLRARQLGQGLGDRFLGGVSRRDFRRVGGKVPGVVDAMRQFANRRLKRSQRPRAFVNPVEPASHDAELISQLGDRAGIRRLDGRGFSELE